MRQLTPLVLLLLAGCVEPPAECRWETTPFGWDREFLHADRPYAIRRGADSPTVAVPPGRTAWVDLMAVGGRPEPGQTWLFDGEPVTFVGPKLGTPPTLVTRVVGSPDPPPPYRVVRAYPGCRPSFPIMVRPVPGTDQLLAILEHGPYEAAALVRLPDRPDVTAKDAVTLLDFPGVAYDIAFHPRYAENGFVYVGWNGKDESRKSHFTRVTRYRLDPMPPHAFHPWSAELVIEWDSNGHNGGALAFAADGTLFVSSGDGTADSDADGMGQRTDHRRAKVLRIDVDRPAGGKPYSVPADNPYVADERFVPETWAYGLRNPWRLSFDAASNQLWAGNNGQDQFEQAYLVEKGANYGWPIVEGSHPFHADRPKGPHPIRKPTVEHPHAEARSLTGGFVYRGTKFPELVGAYLYGDYSTGRIWGAKVEAGTLVWQKELARTPLKITAIVPDRAGEVLVCDHQPTGTGGFYTFEPKPPAAATPPFPTKLSETGLYADVPSHTLKPELVPYQVNAPFWSDGLYKVRAVALPPGGAITYKRADGWDFPDGTVIVKSFSRQPGNDWVETRLMTRQGGEWAGYSYRWNAAGTDADLVPAAGADRDLGGQVWHYPSRAECMVCHTRAANYVLGLCELQANRGDQLSRWEAAGLFEADWVECVGESVAKPPAGTRPKGLSKLLPKTPAALDHLADPFDPEVPLETRARSWLHSNCSSCHVEAGGGNARLELGFRTPTAKMRLLGEPPVHAHPDLPGAKLVTPGDPAASVLLRRVASVGPDRMPPVGRNVTDQRAVTLLREWVASLPSTPR